MINPDGKISFAPSIITPEVKKLAKDIGKHILPCYECGNSRFIIYSPIEYYGNIRIDFECINCHCTHSIFLRDSLTLTSCLLIDGDTVKMLVWNHNLKVIESLLIGSFRKAFKQ